MRNATKGPRDWSLCGCRSLPNRQSKSQPQLLVFAEGMAYTAEDGRRILDRVADLVRERGARAARHHRGWDFERQAGRVCSAA